MHDIFDLSSDLPTVDELLSYAIDSDINKSSSIEGLSSQVCRDLLMHLPTRVLHIFVTYQLRKILLGLGIPVARLSRWSNIKHV